MCDCNNKENLVDLPHLKIYTNMATYKVKKQYEGLRSTIKGGEHINWRTVSQEKLAHLYEEVGLTCAITKISSNEKSDNKVSKKSSDNKVSKKSSDNKKDSKKK
jgi:hypothetical protein|tara:strand:- start:263 stop:574 length:312 start_codon:yes stop_codon:yes gene_type:complete